MYLMKSKWISAPVGLAVGVANGVFGAGGGTLLVPALRRFSDLEQRRAQATALAVMLPLSALSVVIYMLGPSAVKPDWPVALYVSAGGAAGGIVGARLLNKLTSKWLRGLFGLFLIIAAARMAF